MPADSEQSRPEGHAIVHSAFAATHNGKTGKESQSSVVFRSFMKNGRVYMGYAQLINGVWTKPLNTTGSMAWSGSEERLAHCYSGVGDTRFYFSVHKNAKSIHMNTSNGVDDRVIWPNTVEDINVLVDTTTDLAATNIEYGSPDRPMILLYGMNGSRSLVEIRGTWVDGRYQWIPTPAPVRSDVKLPEKGRIAVARIGNTTCVIFDAEDQRICARLITRDRAGAPVWGNPFEVHPANDWNKFSPLAITRAAESAHYVAFYIGELDDIYSRTITPLPDGTSSTVGDAVRVSRIIGRAMLGDTAWASLGATPGALPGSAIVFAMTILHGTYTLVTYSQVANPLLLNDRCGAKTRVTLTLEEYEKRVQIERDLKIEWAKAKKDQDSSQLKYKETITELTAAFMLSFTAVTTEFSAKNKLNCSIIEQYKIALHELVVAEEAKRVAKITFETTEANRLQNANANQWTQLQLIKTDARVLGNPTTLDYLPNRD